MAPLKWLLAWYPLSKCVKCCTESNLKIALFKIFNFSAFINHPTRALWHVFYKNSSIGCTIMFCMHTYPYYGIVSATGDVAIKKPKVRTMDFHGLSLRPLVVKGLSALTFSLAINFRTKKQVQKKWKNIKSDGQFMAWHLSPSPNFYVA